MMTPEQIRQVQDEADCLYTQDDIERHLDLLAGQISADHAEDLPLMLCVMTGALIPAGHLLTRMNFPLEIDYIHATRYQGETRGGNIDWRVEPTTVLTGRLVIIIDDILDEGVTLHAIREYCDKAGARQVKTVVLVDKQHDRKQGSEADYVGLSVEDRYVFGFGMDYKGYLRNVAGIYAVRGL